MMNEDEARQFASELYRGILRREPDTDGLAGYTRALMADGSPERLIELTRSFRASAEAQAIEAKVRGEVVNQRRGPIGPINHVISLGTNCYPALTIKGLGLKRASYPFDWIFSSPAMIVDALRDNFARFLDPKQHRATPIERRRTPKTEQADHLHYRDRFGVETMFMHRDITEPVHKAYYHRTVERFRAVMMSDQTKLLFMTNSKGRHATADDFLALCGLIDERYRNAHLIVVNVEQAADGDVARVGGRLDRQIGPHELIKYRASSGLNSTSFDNWLDHLVMRSMLAQYELVDRI